MGVFSRLHPAAETASCQQLLHPWTSSCSVAMLDMVQASLQGSARFFFLIYGVQLFVKICRGKEDTCKLKEAKYWRNLLLAYSQSVLFGSTMSIGFLSFNCFYRLLLGKFSYWTLSFLPAFTAGAAIFVESPQRRGIACTSYANLALEALVRQMENARWLTWSENQKVVCFMVINAGLMYMMKIGLACNVPHLWFFTPRSCKDTMEQEEDIRERCVKSWTKFFVTGVVLQIARTIMTSPHLLLSPMGFIMQLCTKQSLRLPVFLAFYVVLYEVVEWWLLTKKRLDSNENLSKTFKEEDLPNLGALAGLAGLCSGLCFKLKPSTSILNSALISMLQILLSIALERKLIPRLPYCELSMLLWNGILYHSRAMHTCPSIMVKIMSAVSHKRSDYIIQYYRDFIRNLA